MTQLSLVVLLAPAAVVFLAELWCFTRLAPAYARAVARAHVHHDAHLPGVTLAGYRRALEGSSRAVLAVVGHEVMLRPARQHARIGRAEVQARTPVLVHARLRETAQGLDADVRWAPVPAVSAIVALANVGALALAFPADAMVWGVIALVVGVVSVVRVIAARSAARALWVELETEVLDHLRVAAMPEAPRDAA